MSTAPVLTAWDFLPDNLREDDGELFPWIAGLIDWALPPPDDAEYFPVDPLVTQLGLKYADDEAVGAYFNKFLKPVIGTRPAMEYAFDLAGISATIIEWFQSETPIPSFKFIVQFEDYPGTLDIDGLLDLIYALKNERSWPTAIRMAECVDNLVLDYGSLDCEPMDAAEGYMNELGVTICLYQYYKAEVAPETLKVLAHEIGRYSQRYEFTLGLQLDYTDLSQPFDESWAATTGAWSSETVEHVPETLPNRYIFPEPLGFTPVPILVGENSPQIVIGNSGYRTATFEAQMVLSDYGTLSGGEGFIGEEMDLADQTLDSFTLSDNPLILTPILVFEWIDRVREAVDQSEMFAGSVFCSAGVYSQRIRPSLRLDDGVLDYSAILDCGVFSRGFSTSDRVSHVLVGLGGGGGGGGSGNTWAAFGVTWQTSNGGQPGWTVVEPVVVSSQHTVLFDADWADSQFPWDIPVTTWENPHPVE